jgi:hypothetical protein
MNQKICLGKRFGSRWVGLLLGVLGLATALRAQVVMVGIYDGSPFSASGANVIILGPTLGTDGEGGRGKYYGDVEQHTIDAKIYYRLPTANLQIGLGAGAWFVLSSGIPVGPFTGHYGSEVPDPTIKQSGETTPGPGGGDPPPPPPPRNPPLIEWVGNLPDTVAFGYGLPLEVKAKAPDLNMQQITLEARYQENVNGTLVAQVVQIAANPYVGRSKEWQAIGNPFGLTVRDDDVDVTFVGEAKTSAGLTAMVTRSVKFLGRKSDKGDDKPTVPPPPPGPVPVASGTLNVDAPTVACTFDWETAKFTAVPSNLAEPVTFAWQVDNLDIGGGSTQSAKLAGGAHRVAVKMTGSDGTVVNAAQDFTMPTPLPPFPRVILTADRSMWRATGKVRIHWEIVPVPGPSTWRPQAP